MQSEITQRSFFSVPVLSKASCRQYERSVHSPAPRSASTAEEFSQTSTKVCFPCSQRGVAAQLLAVKSHQFPPNTARVYHRGHHSHQSAAGELQRSLSGPNDASGLKEKHGGALGSSASRAEEKFRDCASSLQIPAIVVRGVSSRSRATPSRFSPDLLLDRATSNPDPETTCRCIRATERSSAGRWP
ncbi:hypothetical protein MHYP_G00072590 [Metynnis hypsauchen]